MPDRRFFRIDREWTLGELAAALSLPAPDPEPADRRLTGVASLAGAGPGDLAHFSDLRERAAFESTAAGAVIVSEALVATCRAPASAALLCAERPFASFAEAARRLYGHSMNAQARSPGPAISPDAVLGEGVRLAPGVVIGPGAHIGADSEIGANSVIGMGVVIGAHAHIGPQVSVQYCLAGEHLTLAAGVRIGESGFGFRPNGWGGYDDFPHLGRVLIGDHVSIGANSCVDRGALDDTEIGDWCRIDNLVQIGHNVCIGRRCILAGMVGIAGSVTLGNDVSMGGQAGVIDHISIGDGALIAGGAFVSRDVAPGMKISGVPGIPLRQKQRELVLLKRMTSGGTSGPVADSKTNQGDREGQDG